jgi:predicted transcriptional regulator YheO
MREVTKIASALGETLAPTCEVVVHDLTDPEHAIVQIENNLSGRKVGDSATELGLARIADPSFPDVIANYPNGFSDGRPVKSTSIGLKDKSGNFVAALCINMDLSHLKSIGSYLAALTRTSTENAPVGETLASQRFPDLRARISAFAVARNRDPQTLKPSEKREIVQQLNAEGEFERRGAVEQIASIIGVSRSNLYYYLKNRTKNG